MITLEQRLETESIALARAKSPELGVFRLLRNALQQAQIAARGTGKEMSEDDALQVMRREYKKRVEATTMYEQAGRNELAVKERFEAEIIARFLPTAPSEEQVLTKAKELVVGLSVSGPAGIGPLTKLLLQSFGSALDGQTASRIARQVLEVK